MHFIALTSYQKDKLVVRQINSLDKWLRDQGNILDWKSQSQVRGGKFRSIHVLENFRRYRFFENSEVYYIAASLKRTMKSALRLGIVRT